GSFTWNPQPQPQDNHAVIDKGITLQGAGIGQTIINDNLTKDGTTYSIPIVFNTVDSSSPRITGFTIQGQAQDTQNWNLGTIAINGTSHSVRVDQVKFDQPGTGCLTFNGYVFGVVDHCDFSRSGRIGVQVFHDAWPGASGTLGDGSWYDATYLGTDQAIYIEDCTFENDGQGGSSAIDSYRGGRFVFRYNTLTNDNAVFHGTEGNKDQGTRCFEIYQNTFTANIPNAPMTRAISARGGTGVVWGNTAQGAGDGTITGYIDFFDMQNYGDGIENYGPPWYSPPNGLFDENQDLHGYKRISQVVARKEADPILRDVDANPYNGRTGNPAPPNEASEPVYEWADNWTPVPNNPGQFVIGLQGCIQPNRDYFVGQQKPGYVPYCHPHPLVSGVPCAAPTHAYADPNPLRDTRCIQ